ncbi:OmpA family protein [Tenacibaculum finnmarkense]|uniref:Cell envelope biogenesis protein OmpA n=1 Tax=Tenacibaculum finnmarkense genomovar ulcerans TaxID=2781388 RepID=A0A2I2M9W6_9FLAO|nr:OmpA family protein [Tenacibaculum finnmarkense]ALU73976.1 cell envelope biogenesis protein OmpA [Tenacibaculum dicentrarchi]MBE7634135.1 OmpA family protein [Tenacibaculum finnmarkense genomovar ulcerans]MBE7646111.1 OmpA family protein [Tenacibaculum finnmarkense genomovar ulcerans]MBE7697907.1 OmpA family protein [Tenacibaculum finnmarkense genomovar ulcerans]MCD8430083.1 OmpA family protein [Tenacibaculum finnmarkense genomovar ulcerans]
MKQIKLAVIALFTFATLGTANAQDSDNPWVVGFGVNSVDIRGSRKFGKLIKDGLGTSDWNILPSVSRISAEKYLSDGFTVQVAGSLNKIETFLKKDDSDFLYYAIDANVKYDLDPLVNLIFKNTTPYFNPYIYLGGGYTSIDSSGEGMLNAGAGFNTWFNDNLGLNFQTGAKHGFGDNVRGHYQHSIGLVFKFGGTDTDGDGVFDKDDACPEIAGLKEFNGCPDTDADGIKDADDACPEVAGLAALNGCPDTDADGIADKDDACPSVKGTKANNGCPDTDGDGVVDSKDKCPKVAGPVSNNGCPELDTDGDSVLDKDDKCPKVAGVVSNNGCPEVLITKAAEKKLNDFARAIYFNSGRTTFKPGVIANLNRIASIMKEYSKAKFSVQGHTDSQGKAANNLKLSQRRAKAVLDYLAVKAGISPSRLSSAGFGEDYPIADNKTRAGRAENRRVEIKLTK